jgi:HEAT repeat protein
MTSLTKIDRDIQGLIEELSDPDGLKRQRARLLLAESGSIAIPQLIEVLSDPNWKIRWEATKTLAEIKDPAPAPDLVKELVDDCVDVRWAAMEALIAMGRGCLPALLQELEKDFGSARYREGANHILHVLKDKGLLKKEELAVYEALQGLGSDARVAWTAKSALDVLEQEKTED